MDNDILINQARQLYADLCVLQSLWPLSRSSKLERLITFAYCRYQRRLNRCVLCYQHRTKECLRLPGEKKIPCSVRYNY